MKCAYPRCNEEVDLENDGPYCGNDHEIDHLRDRLEVLEEIRKRLDGREWGGDASADIASIMQTAGYTIRDIDERQE